MLHRFFKNLISIFCSSSFILNEKTNAEGICYVGGPRRYLSILLDLIIICIILSFFLHIQHFFYHLTVNPEISVKVAVKSSIKLPLSLEEEIAYNRFIILYTLIQIFACTTLSICILYIWLRFATTPGKFLLQLRIVDANTFKKITLKQAIKRQFALIALWLLPIFTFFVILLLWHIFALVLPISTDGVLKFSRQVILILSAIPLPLNYIWASFDKQGQTWHDKIAGTVVVTSKSLATQETLRHQ